MNLKNPKVAKVWKEFAEMGSSMNASPILLARMERLIEQSLLEELLTHEIGLLRLFGQYVMNCKLEVKDE